ncbi:MAG: orotate phosphoribosyltransferase [Panacagrimonas sp.]|nr:orotate phosphoribosyltransferase [Panacagrimonas sp.]MCC2659167.1 orotate phosphoribosyltransferase [Panacagrimonas sp.]
MKSYQSDFLALAIEHGVLRFGEFTLKSGRVSPYFFNLGRISSGAAMLRLSRAYAAALQASDLSFDMLFGPAYKGIPLAATVACALAEAGHDLPYAYNRKEAKDHGEGGTLVGAEPRGRVVIVDDVLTAGTALREAISLLRAAGATPVAALVALDRQEVGPNGRSAVAELERESGVRVVPLVTVADVMTYLGRQPEHAATLVAMRNYQARYGVH